MIHAAALPQQDNGKRRLEVQITLEIVQVSCQNIQGLALSSISVLCIGGILHICCIKSAVVKLTPCASAALVLPWPNAVWKRHWAYADRLSTSTSETSNSNLLLQVRCTCGVTDDDGSELIECETQGCKIWQHTACRGVTKETPNFLCSFCLPDSTSDKHAESRPEPATHSASPHRSLARLSPAPAASHQSTGKAAPNTSGTPAGVITRLSDQAGPQLSASQAAGTPKTTPGRAPKTTPRIRLDMRCIPPAMHTPFASAAGKEAGRSSISKQQQQQQQQPEDVLQGAGPSLSALGPSQQRSAGLGSAGDAADVGIGGLGSPRVNAAQAALTERDGTAEPASTPLKPSKHSRAVAADIESSPARSTSAAAGAVEGSEHDSGSASSDDDMAIGRRCRRSTSRRLSLASPQDEEPASRLQNMSQSSPQGSHLHRPSDEPTDLGPTGEAESDPMQDDAANGPALGSPSAAASQSGVQGDRAGNLSGAARDGAVAFVFMPPDIDSDAGEQLITPRGQGSSTSHRRGSLEPVGEGVSPEYSRQGSGSQSPPGSQNVHLSTGRPPCSPFAPKLATPLCHPSASKVGPAFLLCSLRLPGIAELCHLLQVLLHMSQDLLKVWTVAAIFKIQKSSWTWCKCSRHCEYACLDSSISHALHSLKMMLENVVNLCWDRCLLNGSLGSLSGAARHYH